MKLQREFGDQRRTVRVHRATRQSGGYLMNEMLVYIGVVFMILGVGYAAVYRCIDRAVVLRRNANDIVSALHAGELWRADCRAATTVSAADGGQGAQVVRVTGPGRSVEYCFTNSTVLRRSGEGPWGRVLDNVKASSMQPDQRGNLTAWRWELELNPRSKATAAASRIRPLFTFIGVPAKTSNP